MRDSLLFLAGTSFGMLIFSLSTLFRELYGEIKKPICVLCKEAAADGYDQDLGSVCAKCEVELNQVGAQLMRLSGKI